MATEAENKPMDHSLRQRIRRALPDILMVAAFALASTLFQIGRIYQQEQVVNLSGDAGNIASFCAAWDNPELFRRDGALGDPDQFRFYATIHIPLIRGLHDVYGDYGTAFASTLGIHVFLYLLGFYVLGRVCTGSVGWGGLFALLFTVPVWLQWGTLWGLWSDALPRVSFAALLGFLWTMAIVLRNRPRTYPLVLAAAGLLMYVHPVSAPTIAFSLLLGYAALAIYRRELTRRRLGWLVLSGLVFAVVITPFAVNYLSNHAHGEVPEASEVRMIMAKRFTPGYMADYLDVIVEFFDEGLWPELFLIFGAAGIVLMLSAGDPTNRGLVVLIAGWIVGCLVCSVGVFLVDHAIARATGGLPVQISLVRGVRFLVPLSYLTGLLGLHATVAKTTGSARRAGNAIAAVLVVALAARLWDLAPDKIGRVPINGARIVLGRIGLRDRVPPSRHYLLESQQALRELTPKGATVLPVGLNPQTVRYTALRPVPYCRKDGGVLAYTNPQKLMLWHDRWTRMEAIEELEPGTEKADRLLAFARYVGAEYLLVRIRTVFGRELPDRPEILWENRAYALLRVDPVGAGDNQSN